MNNIETIRNSTFADALAQSVDLNLVRAGADEQPARLSFNNWLVPAAVLLLGVIIIFA